MHVAVLIKGNQEGREWDEFGGSRLTNTSFLGKGVEVHGSDRVTLQKCIF